MCDACGSHPGAGRRRWSSTRLTVAAFVAALVVLSSVGIALRLTGEPAGASPCASIPADGRAYQAALTADRSAGVRRLKADTAAFIARLTRSGADRCPELPAFVAGIRSALVDLCAACVDDLERIARPPSESPPV